jgi:hypothetical protein
MRGDDARSNHRFLPRFSGDAGRKSFEKIRHGRGKSGHGRVV